MALFRRSSGDPPTSFLGRVFASLFFLVFLLVGLLFTGLLGYAMWRTAMTYTWRATEAVVEESRIDTEASGSGQPELQVRYRYRFDDRDYTSTRLTDGFSSSRDSAEIRRWHEQLAVDTRVTCYVNPRRPDEAVLERGAIWVSFFVVLPLIFVAVGGGGIWVIWRGRPASTSGRQPLSSTAGRRSGRVPALLVSWVFLLFGGGVSVPFLVLPVLRVLQAKRWPAVPCEVVSSSVASHRGDSTTYSVDVVYRYTIGSRDYTASRYQFMGGSSSGYKGKAAIVDRLPAGTRTLCYVDPADPTNAVLERGFTGEMWFGLIPLVFAGGGLLGLFAVRRSPTLSRAKSSAIGLRAPVEASVRTTPSAAGGALVLRPAASRRLKLIGLWVVAVFWNGIVGFFLYHLIGDWREGESPWFLTLFLTPFVALGALIIVGAVRQVLALFNPQPTLTLTPGELVVGGTARLAWAVSGRVDKLRRLEIILEGREEATYRRGTDTRTDRAVFAKLPLAQTTDRAGMQQGSTLLRVPADTMHSFTSSNNRIVWTLHVRAEVPNWPDIDDEFTLTLLPTPVAS